MTRVRRSALVLMFAVTEVTSYALLALGSVALNTSSAIRFALSSSPTPYGTAWFESEILEMVTELAEWMAEIAEEIALIGSDREGEITF